MIVPLSGAVPRVVAALRAGEAAAVPLPSPLPYGVAATSLAALNRAKGRPEEQPAGIVVSDFGEVAPFLAVDDESLKMIVWLCTASQLNVFAPLTGDAPAWMAQDRVQTGGAVGLMGSWLPELQDVLGAFGHLFISSANLTGQAVAVMAREADRSFGGRLLIVDGDAARDPGRRHGSATIVRVSAAGELTLTRHGVNDEAFAGGDEAYLAELRRRYGQHR